MALVFAQEEERVCEGQQQERGLGEQDLRNLARLEQKAHILNIRGKHVLFKFVGIQISVAIAHLKCVYFIC